MNMKTDYIELSKMTEEKRKEYLADYKEMFTENSILGFKLEKPTEEFNEYGLKYSSEFLQKINVAIVMMPIEIMQNYVDVITKNLVDNDPEELKGLLNSMENTTLTNMNATSIGNLAYIILNSKDEILQNKCKAVLNTLYHSYIKLIEDCQNQIAQC